jgi:hypothetical protein
MCQVSVPVTAPKHRPVATTTLLPQQYHHFPFRQWDPPLAKNPPSRVILPEALQDHLSISEVFENCLTALLELAPIGFPFTNSCSSGSFPRTIPRVRLLQLHLRISLRILKSQRLEGYYSECFAVLLATSVSGTYLRCIDGLEVTFSRVPDGKAG